MTPTLEELAEDAMAYVLPSPMFEPRERDGYVYVAGQTVDWVVRIRRVDLEAVHEEARGRGTARLEWWFGWSAPDVPPGLVPDEVPVLTGMTCTVEPPPVEGVEIRPATAEEVVELERAVWRNDPSPPVASDAVHHFAALIDGKAVGIGRAVDMQGAVALMGGVVLEEFRGRGAYRALVRARWEHAARRGTPCLVVQAGAMSEPVLRGLGFDPHGVLRLFVDPGVGSGHGHD